MANVSGQLLWDFCTELLEGGAGYVWGARGEVYTEAEAEYLYNLYKTGTYDKKYYFTTSMARWKGKVVVDCSGMIQAFRRKHYDGKDATAQGLFEQCDETGTIDTLPSNSCGVLLFRKDSSRMGHVGVYGGDGTTIESLGSKYGVVKKNLKNGSTKWTHWGIPKWLDPVTIKDDDDDIDDVIGCERMLGRVANCSYLNVRRGPGTSYKVYKVLKKGDLVTVYEERYGWYKISLDGDYWISGKYFEELPKLQVQKCFALTVRDSDSTKGKKLRYLKKGQIVYMHDVAPSGWFRIGINEYASNKYLVKI